MSNTQQFGIWLALLFLGFLLSPLVRSGDNMSIYLNHEVAQTRQAMGDGAGDLVVQFANALFEKTPLSAAAKVASKTSLTKKEQTLSARIAGPGGAAMASMFNSYMQGLIMQTYVVAMRLAIVLFWLFFLLPLLAASVYDGFMLRKIKSAEFGVIRPATFTIAGMVVIPILVMPVFYLVLPFHISPVLAPIWAAAVVWPLSILVSNSQPLFGR